MFVRTHLCCAKNSERSCGVTTSWAMRYQMKKTAITATMAVGFCLCLAMFGTACEKSGIQEAVPLKYDAVRQFSDGMAAVMVGDQWGFIDKAGNEAVPLAYSSVKQFSEGLAAVREGDWRTGKWGFIDREGNVAVPFEYDGAGSFSGGLARVTQDGKCGYIDKTGKIGIPFEYDAAADFSEGLAAVNIGATNYGFDYTEGGKWGFIDKTGEMVVPAIYDSLHMAPADDGNLSPTGFHEGLAAVMAIEGDRANWGFIDKTGKVVVPIEYEVVFDYCDGIAMVAVNAYYDHIDLAAFDQAGREVVLPGEYDLIYDFSEGLAAARDGAWLDGKWGFIDKSGSEILPFNYDEVGAGFSEGLVAVSAGEHIENGIYQEYVGKWGFVDKDGKAAVPMKYDYAAAFSDGMAAVNIGAATDNSEGDLLPQGGKWGFINKKGKETVPCKYDSAEDFNEGMAAVCQGGKWGFLSRLNDN